MGKVINSTRNVPFETHELEQKKQLLIDDLNKLEEIENEFKTVKSTYSNQIKELKAIINKNRVEINVGEHSVDVTIEYHFPLAGMKTIKRKNSDEIWEENMSDSELENIPVDMLSKEDKASMDNIDVENSEKTLFDNDDEYLNGAVITFKINDNELNGKILEQENDEIINKKYYKVQSIDNNIYQITREDIVR